MRTHGAAVQQRSSSTRAILDAGLIRRLSVFVSSRLVMTSVTVLVSSSVVRVLPHSGSISGLQVQNCGNRLA